jgi:predicted TIM-barrel fold metal-dependent hydrolase
VAVIDFRVRPPTGGFLDLLLFTDAARRDRITRMHGFAPAPSAQAKSIAMMLEEMDVGGVTLALLPARHSDRLGSIANDEVLRIASAHPQRFVAAAAVDPSDRRAARAVIEDAKRAGFRALNVEPGASPTPMRADDRRLYPIYADCEDAGLPIIVMAGGSAGPDLGYTDPVAIDRVAADFPTLRIVVAHGGWPWVHQILHIAYRRPNLYVSADQYLANMAGMRDYVDAINGFLGDRFIYGSSYPFLPIDAYADWFRSLPIRPDVLPRVMHDNAAELLALDAHGHAPRAAIS